MQGNGVNNENSSDGASLRGGGKQIIYDSRHIIVGITEGKIIELVWGGGKWREIIIVIIRVGIGVINDRGEERQWKIVNIGISIKSSSSSSSNNYRVDSAGTGRGKSNRGTNGAVEREK